MMDFKNPIIPAKQHFLGKKDQWNYPAICIFAATGFFLDEDTYYQGLKVLKPATLLHEDSREESYFKWHYTPRVISLKQVTEEFADLFERIIAEQVSDQKVILPLSGGLDSRTQAAALLHLGKEVHSYGYRFAGGHDETRYGKRIAKACGFPFEEWEVPKAYLWNCIDQLAQINGCYSEFTHPRQMAFLDHYTAMGEVFSLGHWGDVLFDDMGVPEDLNLEQQTEVVLKKIIKKGGLELANALWETWALPGSFEPYLRERVWKLLSAIDIPHSANARIRAFKSLYWAPRWTSVNLSVFETARPITLPYYEDRMCRFICTVPEQHLSGRKIQIEYLKMRAPGLARIPWQDHRPFNLYNYDWDKSPWDLPFRAWDKTKRTYDQLAGKQFIQRNWELQFMGKENRKQLSINLSESAVLQELIPREIVHLFLDRFHNHDPVKFSHPLSVLLTISRLKTTY